MSIEAMKLAIQLRDSASSYWNEQDIPILERLIEILTKQEPVEWCSLCGRNMPQPLSDRQIEQLFPERLSDDGLAAYWLTFARAIESAHGISEK